MRLPVARFAATINLLVATWSLSSAATTLSAPTRIKVDADGGYSGIVVKIDKDVPEEECGRILASLKVILTLNERDHPLTVGAFSQRIGTYFFREKLPCWESFVINRLKSTAKGCFEGMRICAILNCSSVDS